MLNRKLIVAAVFAAFALPGLALAQDAAKPPEPAKAPEPPKAPYTLTANVFLVSDYFFRGLTQTWGKPAIQGGADFVHDSGIYLGTWASNVSGNQFAGGSMEWDFYGGYNYKLNDDITLSAGLYEYYYPGANFDQNGVGLLGSQSYNTFEGNLAATWKFVTLKFNYSFSDYFGASKTTGFEDDTSGTYYLQLDAAYPLPQVEGLSIIGHIGYTHYSADLNPPGVNGGHTNPSYTDWKIGVSYVIKDGWTAGLYYVGTNNTDYYDNTASLANSSTKNLGGSSGYITIGRTF
jgi:uncharacterized protein (TIGR02001 family)